MEFFIKEAFSILKTYTDPQNAQNVKGLLVYGPPGTGKSFLLNNLLPALGLETVYSGNSSSFSQTYKG